MESILENDLTTVEEFLSTIPSKATRKNYKNSIRKFEEYFGRSIESLLEKKGNLGKIIEKYYVWLREKGYKQNSCRAYTNGPIQFLKYNNLEVRVRRSLGINRTEIGTSDHFLVIDQVRKMHRVADLKEKVILKIWTWGLRVGDSCRLEWKLFDVLDQKPPIPLQILTRKEGVVAYPFIDRELLDLLSAREIRLSCR